MSFATRTVLLHALKLHTAVACLIVGLCTSPAAWANDYAEVNRLIRAGQWSEALTRADAYLMSRPQDPQMRFIKGVILTEAGKTSEAIATFQKLTDEFPELPEPYNNLAVLHAAQNQFDKARQALEMAIRTNPSYATAHENLGDVYAKLASQSYSKALQLDNTNTVVPPKLALIRNLFAAEPKASKTPAPTTPTSSAPSASASSARAAPSPVAATPTSPPSSSTPPAPPPQSDTSQAREDVGAAVHAWAKAWSNKDMGRYLGAYDSDFRPPGGRSRTAWEQERRDRIVPKNAISVEVSGLEVKVTGDKATATFRQHYKADALATNSRKTLEWVLRKGRWLIVRESTG